MVQDLSCFQKGCLFSALVQSFFFDFLFVFGFEKRPPPISNLSSLQKDQGATEEEREKKKKKTLLIFTSETLFRGENLVSHTHRFTSG